METPVQMKIMEKLRIIFKTINLMLESSLFSPKNIGELYPQKIKEIVFEQKLFEKMDMERISKLKKNILTKMNSRKMKSSIQSFMIYSEIKCINILMLMRIQ